MGSNASKPPHTNISDLPDELMYAVFILIDAIQLMPFSRVCKRWRWLIDDSRLRKVIDFDFGWDQWDSPSELHLMPILSNAPLLNTFKIARLRTTEVINNVITQLAENCPHLSVLEFASCRDISQESWQLIGTAPWLRLTHLSLPECKVNNHVLATILPTLSTVTVLNIVLNGDVTDDGILCITGHTPNLRCLLIYQIDIFGSRYLSSASTVPLLNAVGSHLTQLSLSKPDCTLLSALPTACACLRVLAMSLGNSPIDAVAGCLHRLTHLTHLSLNTADYDAMYRPERFYGLFDVTPECLSKLEHLALIGIPVDDRVIEEIAQTCGSRLRYLSMITNTQPFTAVGLTEVARRCTAIEHMELDLNQTPKIYSTIAKVISTIPRLRVFVIRGVKDKYTNSLKDKLAGIMPNVLICSWVDLYLRGQYKRWRLPDISRAALQYGSFQ